MTKTIRLLVLALVLVSGCATAEHDPPAPVAALRQPAPPPDLAERVDMVERPDLATPQPDLFVTRRTFELAVPPWTAGSVGTWDASTSTLTAGPPSSACQAGEILEPHDSSQCPRIYSTVTLPAIPADALEVTVRPTIDVTPAAWGMVPQVFTEWWTSLDPQPGHTYVQPGVAGALLPPLPLSLTLQVRGAPGGPGGFVVQGANVELSYLSSAP